MKTLIDQLTQKENAITSIVGQLELKQVPDIEGFSSAFKEEMNQIIDDTVTEYVKFKA